MAPRSGAGLVSETTPLGSARIVARPNSPSRRACPAGPPRPGSTHSLASHHGAAERRRTCKRGYAPRFREDCSRGLFRVPRRVKQRPALGALFALLAIAFAGVAFAAGNG